MTTFFQNGTAKEIPYFLKDGSSFYIQRMDRNPVDQYVYLGDKIKYELDSELVELYDRLRDLFFLDTEKYYCEINLLPIFIQEAGQDSECALTSEKFIKLLQKDEFSKIPNLYRHLYLVDCQFFVGTIQNLLIGLENSFVEYYVQISSIGNNIEPSSPNTIMIEMSPTVMCLSRKKLSKRARKR